MALDPSNSSNLEQLALNRLKYYIISSRIKRQLYAGGSQWQLTCSERFVKHLGVKSVVKTKQRLANELTL